MNATTASYETTTAPVITNVPKLTSSARLVELSISVWTGRKQDKNASTDAANANGADKALLNTTKMILGNCPELDAVRKFAANARNYVYSSTTVWGDLGQRLIPMATFAAFYKELDGMRIEFDRLVEDFLSVYDYRQSNAQARLGNLFNPDEYPTAYSLRNKFRFQIAFPPIPEANIYSDIQDEAERYVAQEYARHYTERLEATMKDVWERVYDALKHMSERLDYTGGSDAEGKSDKKKFNDTLVGNVRELCGMLPHFNITGDSRMTTLHAALDQALSGVTPDALRSDGGFRKDTKKKVDDILSSMAW